ncbi:MAG: Bug family tripartite tricarboxylate transporter substrate binding protein [Quisquiliibacterium sp.]|jgi:tripartite-type tricarboxylate transporter receptor subunit TctC
MNRRTLLKTAPALILPALAPLSARAATYPIKPVKIIASVQPGGGVDLVARTMAEQLSRSLGKSFVVENMAGGGGVIATQAVARSAPDGYTLMVGYVSTHGTTPAVRKLPYDAIKDFTPIGMVGGTPNVFVVPTNSEFKTLKQLLAYAHANPAKLSFGSAGLGSLTHLVMEQFKLAASFFAVHVPYRGIGPAITDLIGGQTQIMFPGLAAALPHIRSGKLRPLAITGAKRHALLPDIPTFEENGFKGFNALQWYGIVGPAKIPADIVTLLNGEMNKALAQPELRQRLSSEALDPLPMSPNEFGRFIQNEIERYTTLARERKITLD